VAAAMGGKREQLDVELAEIAHDLSNLMAAIRGFATVIGEDHHDDPVVRADLDHILKAVEQGLALAHRVTGLAERRAR
jgi:signal transduction histidine kinase